MDRPIRIDGNTVITIGMARLLQSPPILLDRESTIEQIKLVHAGFHTSIHPTLANHFTELLRSITSGFEVTDYPDPRYLYNHWISCCSVCTEVIGLGNTFKIKLKTISLDDMYGSLTPPVSAPAETDLTQSEAAEKLRELQRDPSTPVPGSPSSPPSVVPDANRGADVNDVKNISLTTIEGKTFAIGVPQWAHLFSLDFETSSDWKSVSTLEFLSRVLYPSLVDEDVRQTVLSANVAWADKVGADGYDESMASGFTSWVRPWFLYMPKDVYAIVVKAAQILAQRLGAWKMPRATWAFVGIYRIIFYYYPEALAGTYLRPMTAYERTTYLLTAKYFWPHFLLTAAIVADLTATKPSNMARAKLEVKMAMTWLPKTSEAMATAEAVFNRKEPDVVDDSVLDDSDRAPGPHETNERSSG